METPSSAVGSSPSYWAAAAVALCGVCAFLQLYCTQPLLPLFTALFHASKTAAGLTVSAATLGVALSAPIFGALTERLPRKRVIVASIVGISVPTLLAASSTSLPQLIFWRFLQGILVPGIVAVIVTYIGEEWPPDRVALIMSFYVSGTALGGFLGRIATGILTDWFSWRIGFLVLGLASLAGAAAVAAWLPRGMHGRQEPANRTPESQQPWAPPLSKSGSGKPHTPSLLPQTSSIYQAQQLFRSRRLLATFAVGFNVLFSLVAVFTWITFRLAAPPFSLSTAALSSLFLVYLVGFVVTPAAGYLITRAGLRAGIAGAILCSMAGVLLTLLPSLPVVLLGLALVCSGVFIAQTAAQSHLRVAAPPESRVTAAGIYLSCYYFGGTAAGVLPGVFWNLGKWPACAAFILFMQALALTIALIGWGAAQPAAAASAPAP